MLQNLNEFFFFFFCVSGNLLGFESDREIAVIVNSDDKRTLLFHPGFVEFLQVQVMQRSGKPSQ